jgi:uncharacterized protein YbjT (DUF2867 family)
MMVAVASSQRPTLGVRLLPFLSPLMVVLLVAVLKTEAFQSSSLAKPTTVTAGATSRIKPRGVVVVTGRTTTSTSLPLSTSSQQQQPSFPSPYRKVFVAGGSKGVGRAIVEKLAGRGTEVVALVRSDEAKDELDSMEGVTAVLGDAFDRKAVESAMDGCDAAVTTLGGKTADGRRVDYEGNGNVIESAGILGVPRVILVTSIGCGTSREAAPPSVFEVLKEVLAAKEKAENLLIDYYTNVNWTIIRPGGLVTAPMTGRGVLTEDSTAIGSIHREDVAELVVRALDSPKTERKVLAAIDPSITSSVAVEGKVIPAFAL